MKRSTAVRTIAFVLIGATMALPVAAGADPVATIRAGGRAVTVEDAVSLPATFEMNVTGCPTTWNGLPTIIGDFASLEGDPMTSPGAVVFEAPTDPTGTVDWNVTFDPEPGAPDLVARSRWFCATETPMTLDPSDSLAWVGPLYTITISNQGGAASAARQTSGPLKAAKTNTVKAASLATRSPFAAAAASPVPTASMGVDADALPAIDMIGIQGPRAAQLKERVDAAFAIDRRPIVAVAKVLGRSKRAQAIVAELLDEQYVRTAHRIAGARSPSRAAVNSFTNRLHDGETRVTLIEDIALTARSAAWWNA